MAASMVAQLTMILAGAHHGALLPYLAGTLITSVYDGVIAMLLYASLGRLIEARSRGRY